MRDEVTVDTIRIASPCQARWEDMDGSDRARFCGQCKKHVYNFSAMTRVEVESLIREKEGRLCARFYQRQDGRMLTSDCQVGVQLKRNRLARLCGAVAGFLMCFLGGCTRRPPAMQGGIAPPAMMGDVYCPPATNNILPTMRMGEIAAPPVEPTSPSL